MSPSCDEIEKFGKGIGNAARYRIVEALFSRPRTVNELVHAAKLSQPAVSQHLKTLKASNIVKDKRQGQTVLYSLNSAYILGLLKDLTGDVDRCDKKNKNKLKK